MAKKLDFDKEKNNRNDNAIEEIMQADFPLPKQAEDAKNEAFARIREMALPKFQSPTDTNWDSIRLPSRTNCPPPRSFGITKEEIAIRNTITIPLITPGMDSFRTTF